MEAHDVANGLVSMLKQRRTAAPKGLLHTPLQYNDVLQRENLQEIDRLHGHLHSLSATMSALLPYIKLEEQFIHSRANRIRNSSNLAVKLPVEILESIFVLACESCWTGIYGYFEYKECFEDMKETRNSLMATCARWRLVAKETDILWRFIPHISLTNSARTSHPSLPSQPIMTKWFKKVSRVKARIDIDILSSNSPNAQLERLLDLVFSKAQYLSYHLDESDPSPFLDSLLQHPARSFPYLEKLSIAVWCQPDVIVDVTLAPCLKDLYIDQDNWGNPLEIKLPPYLPLTRLILNGEVAMPDLESLFASCPNLDILQLATTWRLENPNQVIRHDKLRHLSFFPNQPPQLTTLYFPGILEMLELPNLVTLRIPSYEDYDEVLPKCRNPRGVKSLHVQAHVIAGEESDEEWIAGLHTFLSLFTNVKSLTFECYTWEAGGETRFHDNNLSQLPYRWLAESLKSAEFLPQLEVIELEYANQNSALTLLDARSSVIIKVREHDSVLRSLPESYVSRVLSVGRAGFPCYSELWTNWSDVAEEWW